MAAVIIAHRTCPRHAPENSLAGIRKAAELGADAVEIAVQRTLDGHVERARRTHREEIYRFVQLPHSLQEINYDAADLGGDA